VTWFVPQSHVTEEDVKIGMMFRMRFLSSFSTRAGAYRHPAIFWA
jgi:hypothetical protein